MLTDHAVYPAYANTSGRTSTSAALSPGEKTLVAIAMGQSLAANFGVSLYTPTNAAKVQNLHIPNNTLYRLVDPVLGASGTAGSWLGRLGDKLINAGTYQRVIFIPVAVGGSSIWDWSPSGNFNQRLIAAVLRAKAFGWLETNPDVDFVVLAQLGEADGVAGTSTATFVQRALATQGTLTGRGFNVPWLFAKSTMVANVADADIRSAIDMLVDHGSNRFMGPDIDSLTGAGNRQDGTHLTDAGNDSAATLWKAAI